MNLESVKKILKISRPRFWLYIAGTFLVGYVCNVSGIKDFFNLKFFYSLFFFLIPANIFLYGINDLFDWETDHFNVKKDSKEYRLVLTDKKLLKTTLFISVLLSLPLFFYLENSSKIWLAIFLFLSFFYSAEPIRLKKRPFLDFSSNILYVIPGIIGYLIFADTLNYLIIFALFCWTSAMHLFSAVPDIEPDTKADIKTSATVLGFNLSLALCTLFWSIFSIILISKSLIFLPTLIYPIISSLLVYNQKLNINKIYWYFPIINGILGTAIFFYILIR